LGGRIHCSCEQPERDEVTNGLRGLEHGGDDAERREPLSQPLSGCTSTGWRE
jgi:hypothetical protein